MCMYVYVSYMSLDWWGAVALSLEGGVMANPAKVGWVWRWLPVSTFYLCEPSV